MKNCFRFVAAAALLLSSLGAGVTWAGDAVERPTVFCVGGILICPGLEGKKKFPPFTEIVCEKSWCALLNKDGSLIGEPQMTGKVNAFSDYGLSAFFEKDRRVGVMNSRSQKVTSPMFESIGRFADNGLASATPITDEDDLFKIRKGFIDGHGNWVIKARFLMAEDFLSNGLAVVSEQNIQENILNPSFGLINAKGQWVLEPVASNFKRLPMAYEGEMMAVGGLYDNNVLLSENGDMAVSVKNKWGLLDKNGQWLIEPRFDELLFEGDTSWMAASEGKHWGAVNAQGEWVIEPKFDKIGKLAKNGLALAETEAGTGFINREGEWVIEPKKIEMRDFSDMGMAAFEEEGGVWGFINAAGEVVIEPKFSKVHDFINGMAQVYLKNNERGFIYPDGSWAIVPEKGRSGYRFNTDMAANGVVLTQYKSSGWGVLGKDGQWKLGPGLQYFPMYDYNNLIVTQQDGYPVSEVDLMSTSGEKIAHFSYGCGYAELTDGSGNVMWSNGGKPDTCTKASFEAEVARVTKLVYHQ